MDKVLFRKTRKLEIIAYFPEKPGLNDPDPQNCLAFTLWGGWISAKACTSYTMPASRAEFAPLLEYLGNDQYTPVFRFSSKDFQKRWKLCKA